MQGYFKLRQVTIYNMSKDANTEIYKLQVEHFRYFVNNKKNSKKMAK